MEEVWREIACLVLGASLLADSGAAAPMPSTQNAGPASVDAGAQFGVLCVRNLPGPSAFRHEGKGGLPEEAQKTAMERKFTVRVDGAQEVIVDQQRGDWIGGLSFQGDHLVSVVRDGRPFLAAHFSFTRSGSSLLEMRYDPFYVSLIIEAPRRATNTSATGSCAPCACGVARFSAAVERDLGTLVGHQAQLTVPVGGIALRFVARGLPRGRTMVHVTVTAPPLDGKAAVRLGLSAVGGLPLDRSLPTCFEASVQTPPFTDCSAEVGTMWKGGSERALLITLESVSGAELPADLRISVADPYE